MVEVAGAENACHFNLKLAMYSKLEGTNPSWELGSKAQVWCLASCHPTCLRMQVKVALRRCKGLADAVRAVSSQGALERTATTVAQVSLEHLVGACEALAALLT